MNYELTELCTYNAALHSTLIKLSMLSRKQCCAHISFINYLVFSIKYITKYYVHYSASYQRARGLAIREVTGAAKDSRSRRMSQNRSHKQANMSRTITVHYSDKRSKSQRISYDRSHRSR